MPLRPPAGFISAFYDPLKNPNAPTIGTATGGDAQASVTFTAPSNVGGSAISSYTAISTPGGFTGSAASSPVTVTGLTNGTAYTFAVWATNTYGPSAYSASSGSATPAAVLGVFAGGVGGNYSNVIQYVTISTTGNATDFGDLIGNKIWFCGLGSSTRGVFAGGGPADRSNVIQYITFASSGNATDFGDLTQPSGDTANLGQGAASNDTRGLFAGGNPSAGYTNVIQYITIATTGNSSLFGELTVQKCFLAGCGSSTRSLFAGGADFISAAVNVIGYVTIASTGNATNFGNLSQPTSLLASFSSSTRGLFAGVGGTYSNSSVNAVEYVTIASTGNSASFGDLITSANRFSGCSSSTRGLVGGGTPTTNVIQYVTMATTGNATDFGDLIGSDNASNAACSNGHGGLS